MKNYIKNDQVNFEAIPYKTIYLCETMRDNWKCDAWQITIDSERFDYFTGLGHRKSAKPQAPTIKDVLYSLISDSSALETSFEYWCADYGYDTDSRKAFETYQACCDIGKKINRLFNSKTRAAMREFFQEY